MIRIACCQMNATVGDLKANAAAVAAGVKEALAANAGIACFPELCLTGYPPEDLLLKPSFIRSSREMLDHLAGEVRGLTAVVGGVDEVQGRLFNAAFILADGAVKGVYHKRLLPNYGVFDEKRYFTPGAAAGIFSAGGTVFGVTVCEDIWHDRGPAPEQVKAGAQLIVNINASPYHVGKRASREEVVRRQVSRTGVPLVYVNLVGGQDELVFDGQSMAMLPGGTIIARGPAFEQGTFCLDIPGAGEGTAVREDVPVVFDEPAEVYAALKLGLRDYIVKNRFSKVVIGLSGGVDSALVAALAADALGREHVTGLFMPSRYSSAESQADAQLLARNLGIAFHTVNIEHIYKMYLLAFEPHFAGLPRDIAEENVQARIRGTVLMAFANKFNWLVLTTGNKSEMSTGYATLYGDMAGGLAVIKDVYKTMVYRLCAYRNRLSPVIPERVLFKAPTAELRPNQKDTDSLPPYEQLDPVLKAYIEEDRSVEDMLKAGFPEEVVTRAVRLVDASEYKRRQSPPGIRITPKAFGRDRRMPITSGFRDTGRRE